MKVWRFVLLFFGTLILLAIPVRPSLAASTHVSTGLAACGGSPQACSHVVLHLLNADRAKYRLAPLHLKLVQTLGRPSCAGSLGHSQAMAKSGNIWHDNSQFPAASFPHDICFGSRLTAENVGVAYTGDLMLDLQTLDQLMIKEPHSKSICASTDNHACNILNPAFHRLGVGVISVNGSTWLTEDFLS